jgi:hypothetical protein
MTNISSPNQIATTQDRRREDRISFAPERRPRLVLPGGSYPVLDMSPCGLRIRHLDPARPPFGAQVTGELAPPDDRSSVGIVGLIVRVQAADVAIRCEEGIIPVAWILEEAARSRREHDDN